MPNKFFITDENELENLINDNKSDKRKISDGQQINNDTLFNDFSSSIDTSHKHLVIYNLLTVSDKEINYRKYPDEYVQKMMSDKQLSKFYMKPILKNHDTNVDALGRFIDGWYVRHNDMQTFFGEGEIPKVVIDEFAKRGAFSEGTGSNIGKAISNNLSFKSKIIDGTYLSTSQGAYSDKLTCNICGKQYFSFDCTHRRGANYPVYSEDGKTVTSYKKCIPETGELTFVESSTVNVPANNTSTLVVYDTISDRIVTMDNIKEYKNIFNVKDELNLTNNDKSTHKEQGLTDEEIEKINKKNTEVKMPENKNQVIDKSKEQTINTNEEKVGFVGNLKSPYRDSALEIFIDKAESCFGIEDSKSEEFFNKLTDEELGVALKTIRFIGKNKKVEDGIESNTQNNTNDSNNNIKDNTNEENDDEKNTLKDEIQTLKDEIAKLKGINNEVPNSNIKDKTEEKTNKFGFNF